MRASTSLETSHRPRRRALSALVAVATIVAGSACVASPASAGTRLSVGPSVPTTATVGDTGLPAQLRILNTSFNGPAQSGYTTDSFSLPDPTTPNSITMVLSCGSQISSEDCPAGSFDPGVLVPGATGTGEAGSACAGRSFAIALIDVAQGKYALTPNAAFTLGPADGSGASRECVIDFAVSVPRAPSLDANTVDAGLQTEQRAFAAAVDIGPANTDLRAAGSGTSQTTVLLATPAINTQASDATLGGAIGDTATITGLSNAVTSGAGTGTVTFQLYSGPQSEGCTGANLVGTFVRPISFTGSPVTGGTATASYTPTAAGTYHWVASFSGDVNNNAVTAPCGAANEVSTVTTTPPPPPPPTPPCVTPPGPGQPAPSLLPGQSMCSSVAQVLPETSTPSGTAKAIAPSGCVTKNFNVQVTGRQIRRVVFYLDAKKIKTLTRPNRGTRFALAVRPNSLRRGTHRVLAKTYFTSASGTKSRTLRVTFSRCARQAALPSFTG